MKIRFIFALVALALVHSSCAPSPASSSGGAQYRGTHLAYPGGSVTSSDGTLCSVSASAPLGSPLKKQQIRFVMSYDQPGRWATREFQIATGASRSLGEVQGMIGNALRRASSAPAGTLLVKLGNIEYGGEVRVISRGGGSVEFAYTPAMQDGNPPVSAAEAAAFAQLLGR